jgi:uncharacterized protein (TIGR03435 family)
VAQAPPDTSEDQLRQMLQTLLAERLKLALHREPKPLSYLALIQGKNGPKLPPAKSSQGNQASGGRILANRMSMPALAMLLSRFERQIVVDRTGLDGMFEFKLEWSPQNAAATPIDSASAVSIFTAVQEQLGLKLESRKGPLEILVIDHAEKIPEAN